MWSASHSRNRAFRTHLDSDISWYLSCPIKFPGLHLGLTKFSALEKAKVSAKSLSLDMAEFEVSHPPVTFRGQKAINQLWTVLCSQLACDLSQVAHPCTSLPIFQGKILEYVICLCLVYRRC